MICTYCCRSGHTAARCPSRPRRRLGLAASAIAALCVSGCAGTSDVPPARLDAPPAALMQPPEPLPPIPGCEGAVDCRAGHYAIVRRQYSALAARHRGLQRWVHAGSK